MILILATGARWLLRRSPTGSGPRPDRPDPQPAGARGDARRAPRLGPPKYVAGPPKRFAQGMGAAFTTAAALLWLGCQLFSLLMRAGVIPDRVSARSARSIWAR